VKDRRWMWLLWILGRLLIASLTASLWRVVNCEMSRCTLGRVKNWPFDIREHFFTERVVQHWNRLPRDVINTFPYNA